MQQKDTNSSNIIIPPALSDTTVITINAVGDLMLGSDYPPNSYRFTPKNILATLKDTLKNADITMGNLEGVIASPATITNKCKDSKNCYAFRMPLHFAAYFRDAGFDFLSIANNHSGDFGAQGIAETMKALKIESIAFAGIKGLCESAFIEKKGVVFGFISAGHGGRHVYINDSIYMKKLIQHTKQQSDVVIIFFHGGAEGSDKERVPRTIEYLHGENRGNVYKFARDCIDAGADLVVGSGPHVSRGMELYKNKLIAYSLGNFATYGMSTKGPLGMAPILQINISKDGNFAGGRIIPTQQLAYNPATPTIDTSGRVIKKIKTLTGIDFPQTGIEILSDGTIQLKKKSSASLKP